MDRAIAEPRFLGSVEERLHACMVELVNAYVIRELRRRPEMTLRESFDLISVLWIEVTRG